MPIRKKMLVFVLMLGIMPMLLILFLSNGILNNQIEKAAQGYLQNALKIGYNQVINRLDEMERISNKTTNSIEFQQALKGENIQAISKMIDDVGKVYDYIDFYMVFDANKRLITNQPTIKKANIVPLNTLLDGAKSKHNTITSMELFDLDDLFYSDSEEYNKYKILISTDDNEDKYFTKCLVTVCVSPVYMNDGSQLIGYLVAGEIANNDKYFPNTYSKNVEDSYLAISIDNIRISSNIQSPRKKNYIGSLTPISINTLKGPTDVYYGKDYFYDGDIHIFMDKPIINYEGKSIGMIGVGIPENKFSIIMNTQRSIILLVSVFCLLIMAFISKYVADRITKPIIKATELANQISKGNNEVVIDNRFLQEKNSETTILLKAFKKMVCDLKKSKKQEMEYLVKLQNQHSEQQKLSEQLAELNKSLEEKVTIRTQDLREAINGLKKAGEVKSLFLANMSHELKTPLSAIINCSEILKKEMLGPMNAKQHRHIGNILDSGQHLLQLINDILDISKIEAGKMTLVLGDYSIADIVAESFNIVKSLAYHKNLNVTINIDPPDFKVKVDANKLKQILCNLLSNAVKFTPQGRNVVLEVHKSEDYVQLIVKDNGIGIKKEDQERIFNEFEQVDSSYEKEYEGTGLGLPLTKKLVEMHGGKVYLTSNPGIGTEVIVILPINFNENTVNRGSGS